MNEMHGYTGGHPVYLRSSRGGQRKLHNAGGCYQLMSLLLIVSIERLYRCYDGRRGLATLRALSQWVHS